MNLDANMDGVFNYPLEENKIQNDMNLLMRIVEIKYQRVIDAEKKLAQAIIQLKDYEISYYKGEPSQ